MQDFWEVKMDEKNQKAAKGKGCNMKNENELVSVIIPIYNCEKYITECVNSIINQKYTNFEIILVDDGSTDNSSLLCENLTKKDSRIRYIRQENQGVSVARNSGIKEANGEYIAFIDADDWIDSDYLLALVECLEKNSSDISICSYSLDINGEKEDKTQFGEPEIVFESRKEIQKIQLQILSRKMSGFKNNSGDIVGAPWAKIFRKSFLINSNLKFIVGIKRSQDLLFNLYALERSTKVAYTDEPKYHYRIVDNSTCNYFSKQILDNVKAYLSCMNEFVNTFHKDDDCFLRAFNVKICTSINKCMVQYFFNKNNTATTKETIVEIKEYLLDSMFSNAIKNVKYQDLTFEEKVFVFCLKNSLFRLLGILVKIRRRVKSKGK